MVPLQTVRDLALSLPDTVEQVHFGRQAFAVGKLRFALFDPRKGELALRIPAALPDRARALAAGLLVPSPGRYGAEGWMGVDLERCEEPEFRAWIEGAHAGVRSPRRPR